MVVRDQHHATEPAPDRRRRIRAALSWLPELLVVLLVVAAGANLRFDLDERWLGLDHADADREPAAVLPPAGLDLAAGAPAPPVAAPASNGALDPVAVRRAVAAYLEHPSLGRRLDVVVSELGTGTVVYRRSVGPVVPASTTKLLTGVAVLAELGPETRFRTTVRRTPDGRIALVGGGDPFLATSKSAARGLYPPRATLDRLAVRTAAALSRQGLRSIRLAHDDSLFAGPTVNPAWPATYLPENVVPPITALWTDQGEVDDRYVADPSRHAAVTFAKALMRHGITVRGTSVPVVTSTTDPELAAVESAPLGQIVERMIAVSDNNAAEVLAHHLGLALRQDGSFSGGAAATMEVLRQLGVDTTGSVLYDGSGLSRRNRLTPRTLLDVLQLAASDRHPQLRKVLTGLPVAGFTGSLQWRFDDGPAEALGRVRAKTGTLTGVHGLAGVVTDLGGNQMAFVAIADRVPAGEGLAAQRQLDLIAASLAACACGPTS